MAKTTIYRNTGGPLGENIRIRNECSFPDFSTELLISKLLTSITGIKVRDKLLKEKDLDLPKVVKQIKQNTYDRKDKKNTIPETLTSNREKDIKEEPIHKITHTRKYGTKPKERPNYRNCRH